MNNMITTYGKPIINGTGNNLTSIKLENQSPIKCKNGKIIQDQDGVEFISTRSVRSDKGKPRKKDNTQMDQSQLQTNNPYQMPTPMQNQIPQQIYGDELPISPQQTLTMDYIYQWDEGYQRTNPFDFGCNNEIHEETQPTNFGVDSFPDESNHNNISFTLNQDIWQRDRPFPYQYFDD